MQPFAADFLNNLEAQHAEIARTVDGLPQAALDWFPGLDMNSIAVLVIHVVGAERYWLGDVIAREPSNRDRPAEFQTSGLRAHVATWPPVVWLSAAHATARQCHPSRRTPAASHLG
jgi:hypothetical protein